MSITVGSLIAQPSVTVAVIAFILPTIYTMIYKDSITRFLAEISNLSKDLNAQAVSNKIGEEKFLFSKLLFELLGYKNENPKKEHIIPYPKDLMNYIQNTRYISYKYKSRLKMNLYIVSMYLLDSLMHMIDPYAEKAFSPLVIVNEMKKFILELNLDVLFIYYPSYYQSRYLWEYLIDTLKFSFAIAVAVYFMAILILSNLDYLSYLALFYFSLYILTNLLILLYRSLNDRIRGKIDKPQLIVFTIFFASYILLVVATFVIWISLVKNYNIVIIIVDIFLTLIALKMYSNIMQDIKSNLERLKRFEIYSQMFKKTSSNTYGYL